MSTGKIPYDPGQPDLKLVRMVVFERLRREPGWYHLPNSGHDFLGYVEVPKQQVGALLFQIREVMWGLLAQGVLAPGFDQSNVDFPFFHVTPLGRSILDSEGPNPFDPDGYIDFVQRRVPNADATVLAYLAESLQTQGRGNIVASAVMLGIAAERVFLLLCESLHEALKDPKEKKQFGDLLDRFPMKPKLDWVRTKIEALQKQKLAGVPETAGLMIVAIYDLIRQQRNELGHPREEPPQVTRDDVLGGLQIIIRYYETAEKLRAFLATTKV